MNGWTLTIEKLPPPNKRVVIVTVEGIWDLAWLQEGAYFRTEFAGYPAGRVVRWFLIPDFE